MSGENGNGVSDNDADKRPRIYGKVETTEARVEVTVQGGEGERVDDIEETFDEKVDRLSSTADDLPDEDDDGKREVH